MNDYQKLLKFWNTSFENVEGYKVSGKYVDSDILTKLLTTM